jgi:hypothetical protein
MWNWLVSWVYTQEEEEECQACSETPDKSVTLTTEDDGDCQCLAYMHHECPINRRELGRASWAHLHTMANFLPKELDQKQQEELETFMYFDLFLFS